MTDTSKPGAFCKDQGYFDGAMRILKMRHQIDFKALYAAKVNIETYMQCPEVLIEASKSEDYICPPHFRGPEKMKFFLDRLDQMYESNYSITERPIP